MARNNIKSGNRNYHWKGPVQKKSVDFPLDDGGRRYSPNYYLKILENGERVSRSWLVYSVSANAAFCFCCTLFNRHKVALSPNGYSDWRHLSHLFAKIVQDILKVLQSGLN